jgi:hypothetical protein
LRISRSKCLISNSRKEWREHYSPFKRQRDRDDPLVVSLARATGAIARLDQALAGHPLAPALLYRARLDAARRAAAVDGHGVDPWHLAAVLEGLRLRMDLSVFFEE